MIVTPRIFLKGRNLDSSVVMSDLSGYEHISDFGRFPSEAANCASVHYDVRIELLNSNISVQSSCNSSNLKFLINCKKYVHMTL